MAFTLDQVLSWSGGRLANESALKKKRESIQVTRPMSLGQAQAGDLAFFFSPSYQAELKTARPSILITGEPFVKPLEAQWPLWGDVAVIACRDPYLAMAKVSEKMAPSLSSVTHQTPPEHGSVHATAQVDPSAKVHPSAQVGAFVVIEAGAQVGAGAVIYPSCYIGRGSVVGDRSVLFPRVTLYEDVNVGQRVRIHSGAVLGADGFGYAPVVENQQVIQHQKIYHVGRVVIEDDVEIGANVCIDRATFGETRIGTKSKLDNLVQVGHNVQLGEGTVLCGAVGMAGSGSTGKFVYIGGKAGVGNQVHIGDRAQVGGMSMVHRDVKAGDQVLGHPIREYHEFFKIQAMLSKMLKDRKKERKSHD